MFDGSSTQNGGGVGLVICSPCGEVFRFMCKLEDQASNNQVEYEALIKGPDTLATMKAKYLEIKGDSQLVIKRPTSEVKCYNAKLKELRASAHNLLELFVDVVIMCVPREENQDANDLAQQALVTKK